MFLFHMIQKWTEKCQHLSMELRDQWNMIIELINWCAWNTTLNIVHCCVVDTQWQPIITMDTLCPYSLSPFGGGGGDSCA